jgi:hypothetical protein
MEETNNNLNKTNNTDTTTTLLNNMLSNTGIDNIAIAQSNISEDVHKQREESHKLEQLKREKEEYLKKVSNPEMQAQVIADNYIKSSEIFLNSRERKRIYKECLRNAKKGKYKAYFIPESIAKREERERIKLAKLNQ